jgi:hypothetical protein
MYHPSSKRRQLIVRFLVYGLMTVSVITIVSVLILVILGYSFNRKDGTIEQGGLLQFSSIPSGATVTLDETQLSTRTPSKASVDAKSHNVKMDLTGYRTWQKTIDVRAGNIGWLSYARLIPTDIKPEQLRTFPVLSNTLASPDRKWMLLHEATTEPVFTLANLQGEELKYTTLQLPATAFTAPAPETPPQTFTAESWSADERYVLLKHIYNTDQFEWIVLDRENAARSVNITTLFAVKAEKLQFGSTNGRVLYMQSDGVVRSVNLDSQTLSRPLVSHVTDFKVYDERTIVYTTKPTDTSPMRTVGYATEDLPDTQTIRSYPDGADPLHIAFGEYFGKRYVAISLGTKLDILTGTLPRGTTKAALKTISTQTLAEPPRTLQASNNGRFIVSQQSTGYVTYDLELLKSDTTVWKTTPTVQRDLQWSDDYIVWSDAGGMLRLYEFDGANQQNIMPVAEGYSAVISENNKYIYSVLKTDTGFALQRARLIIAN